jgi:septum formation protein
MDSQTSAQFLAPVRRPRLVLASRSPRRTSLLTAAGFEHTAEHPGFDDAPLRPGNVRPSEWVSSLAYLKAWAKSLEVSSREAAVARGVVAGAVRTPHLIIGADTTCVVDGRMVGTPINASEARSMITGFMGKTHTVLTGVAIVSLPADPSHGVGRQVFADEARVTMGWLSEPDIDAYIASGLWQGKAGAYNLEDRLAAGWPLSYEGDPTTVMGLPMARLTPILESMLERSHRAARLPA